MPLSKQLRTVSKFAVRSALVLFVAHANAQNTQSNSGTETRELKDKTTGVASSTEDILSYAEQMPEFPMDISKFLSSNIKYPKKARKRNIEGRVVLKFVVEKDGSVTNIAVKSTPDEILSDEAIRVVKMMPKWKPAKQSGKQVRVFFTMPIVFKLS